VAAAAAAAAAAVPSAECTRLGWQAVPLEGAGGGGGATIPLPQRPSDAVVCMVWEVVRAVRTAGAAPLHPGALTALARAARAACAAALGGAVARAEESTDAAARALSDSVTQLRFDVRYLDAALDLGNTPPAPPSASPPAPASNEPPVASLADLDDALSRLSKRVDPISHTLSQKPLAHAVRASVDSLTTALAPLTTPTAQPPPATTPPTTTTTAAAAQPSSAASAAEHPVLRLAPPCARFSLLPVQTPPLHAKRMRREAGGAGGGGTLSSHSPHTAAAPTKEYGTDNADGSGGASAVTAVFARVGGVLSDTRGVLSRQHGVLSEKLSSATRSGGAMGGVLAGRLDGLSSTSLGGAATSLGGAATSLGGAISSSSLGGRVLGGLRPRPG